jgi:hypothetical protein
MNNTARQLYLLHGMKRSGNHAVTHWLLPQISCAHVNNLIPLGDILRGRPMPPAVAFASWREQQERGNGVSLDRVLVSLEDHDLGMAPFTQIDVPAQNLLIVRSPRQLLSSRLRKAFKVSMPAYPREDGPVMQRAIALWKQHARCYLGDTSSYPGRVAIFFDRWSGDPGYRAAVSVALDVPFDDGGFGTVTDYGGGSSFDGTRFDGQGHLMSVNDRESALELHEKQLLDALFRDQELAELSAAVVQTDPYLLIRID